MQVRGGRVAGLPGGDAGIPGVAGGAGDARGADLHVLRRPRGGARAALHAACPGPLLACPIKGSAAWSSAGPHWERLATAELPMAANGPTWFTALGNVNKVSDTDCQHSLLQEEEKRPTPGVRAQPTCPPLQDPSTISCKPCMRATQEKT